MKLLLPIQMQSDSRYQTSEWFSTLWLSEIETWNYRKSIFKVENTQWRLNRWK